MDEGRKEERIRWFVEMLWGYPERKIWEEERDAEEETTDIPLQEREFSRETIDLFGLGNGEIEKKESQLGGTRRFPLQDFAMDFQNQQMLFEASKSKNICLGENGEKLSFSDAKGFPERQKFMSGLFLDTRLPKETESSFFKQGFPLEREEFWQSKREGDSIRLEKGVEEGSLWEFCSMAPEFSRKGGVLGNESPLASEIVEGEKVEQSVLFFEESQGLGRTMEELKEVISQMCGQQGPQNISVNISEVKETADVEEIMALLSKRLLEERNISRKKMGER